ncbi:MAG: family 10 glycosylhydrolase [Planctomycetes bacterium]|nr:family 10 glycosylhydrolase [Planctomycetota bacterium]
MMAEDVRIGPGRRPRWAALLAFTAITLGMQSGCALFGRKPQLPKDGSIRAIWVTRWDYKSPADIARVMENCRRAGFNTVLFQVRGNGTVFYRSRLEPWADELGGRDPGYDPLSVACKEAHKRGLQLHAWANVIPGWRGDGPPANRRQLFIARAGWFWRDAWGRRQPFGWYQSLNPCYPEVRKYLADVMHEIVSKYPVDGLHMDYIRFPNEWNDSYPRGATVPDYPRDRRTVAMFKAATGRLPDQAPALWSQWRADQVTRLVADIHKAVKRARPKAWLSAAVGAVPEEAKRNHFQDAHTWIARGHVDAVYPMNYASNLGAYSGRLANWAAVARKIPVVTGVMFDKRDERTVAAQVARARRTATHFAAFAYNSLFERLDSSGRPIMDGQSASRARLRQVVLPQFRRASS